MRTAPAATNRRAAVSELELRELYITHGLTIEQIARNFGLAATTVSRRMREVKIEARRRGPIPGTGRGDPAAVRRDFQWSAELAYAVGLIATDGCLGRDNSRITMTSKDTDLLTAHSIAD